MNFYFEAAKILDRLDAKQGSIKGIVSSLPERSRKRTAALIIETLKYKTALMEVIQKSQLLKQERKIQSPNLALVLVHDLLLAGGMQAGDGTIKQAILRHKTRLSAEFTQLKIKQGVVCNSDLVQEAVVKASKIPRYIRINTKLWTTNEAAEYFTNKGFSVGDPMESSTSFARDNHIPDLLVFPPQISFQDDSAYTAGKIILQDKASCFPSFVLSPPAHDKAVVIDATAAPGNKTSHLSTLMKGKGKLYAFERNCKRFRTLKMMLQRAACDNVEPLNVDFLTIDPFDSQFGSVTHILLDPSCSGSGIVNRLDHLLGTGDGNEDEDVERLNNLASFQLKMIRHAMRFPSAQKIVYSTCSIHAIENEHVISSALESEEATTAGFVLASPQEVLPTWQRRGYRNEMRKGIIFATKDRGIAIFISSSGDPMAVIRCLPGEDATNGFFVSCFVKKSPGKRRVTQLQNDALDQGRKKSKTK